MGAIILAALLTVQCSFGQPIKDSEVLEVKFDATVTRYSVAESNIARALIAVGSEFELPMGVEWVVSQAPHPVNLSWKRATVREVLESIVRTEPGYKLEIADGVVHVYYKGSRDDPTNFLNKRVGQFRTRREYVSLALDRLRRAVRGIVSPQPPENTDFYHIVMADRATVSLDLNNPTVREVLDQLALASDKYNIWTVSFRPGQNLTPTGFRKTLTLWNNSPVPDLQQPVWDRYIWGKLPPRTAQGESQ